MVSVATRLMQLAGPAGRIVLCGSRLSAADAQSTVSVIA
jgi:phosphoheptose isomerase